MSDMEHNQNSPLKVVVIEKRGYQPLSEGYRPIAGGHQPQGATNVSNPPQSGSAVPTSKQNQKK